MVRKVAVAQLKAHLSETLRDVEAGESVAIERRGKTIAVLVPASEAAMNAGDWWGGLYGVMSGVEDFDSIMRATIRSRKTARPRPVRLGE